MEQYFLDFTSLSLSVLLREIREDWVPNLEGLIEWRFYSGPSLARLEVLNQVGTIKIHLLLNHCETPIEVFSLIFKHELLHLRYKPIIENPAKAHSEAFWLEEMRIAPERTMAWRWLFRNFYRCLKRDEEAERVEVKKNWMHEWSRPRIPISELANSVLHNNVPEFLRLPADV